MINKKMFGMMPKPVRKFMKEMPGPLGKRAGKLDEKRKRKKGAQLGSLPQIGAEWDEGPRAGMKHGGVVRAADKSKKNRAWSNRG